MPIPDGLSPHPISPASSFPQTGDSEIDDDHEKIAILIESLLAASNLSMSSALHDLHSSLTEHFFHEDKQMRSLGGDLFACHLDEHVAVLASMKEVVERVSVSEFDLGRRLATYLKRWFPEHVREMDMRLAQALFKVRAGGSVIRLMGRSRESTR